MLSACDDFILADQFESAGDRLASGIVNPNGTGLYFALQSTEMTSRESKVVTILGGCTTVHPHHDGTTNIFSR